MIDGSKMKPVVLVPKDQGVEVPKRYEIVTVESASKVEVGKRYKVVLVQSEARAEEVGKRYRIIPVVTKERKGGAKLQTRAFVYTPESIRNARKALGRSQEAFAQFVGVSVRTIASWEAGKTTPGSELHQRALDNAIDDAQSQLPDLQIGYIPNPAVSHSPEQNKPD